MCAQYRRLTLTVLFVEGSFVKVWLPWPLHNNWLKPEWQGAARAEFRTRWLFRPSYSHYSSMPAIDADIKFAIVPASMARTPRRANSCFLLGARAPIPPI